MKSKAFAKINLGLKVLGKRPDGFHDIETIFARVGIYDELEFRVRQDGEIRVEIEGAQIPQKKNLVWRAAWLLQKSCPRPRSGVAAKKIGVEIKLKKKIPLGAGLGGGSSDAARTLEVLNKLWKLNLPKEKLKSLAISLGSDVPFFLEKSVCRAQGRGEVLEPIALPKRFPREVLIVVPGMAVSTVWAYGEIPPSLATLGTPPFIRPSPKLRRTIAKGREKKTPFCKGGRPELVEGRGDFTNDFEKIVFRKFPEIRNIKKALEKAGAEIASLSGSGSAVFGLFRKRPSQKLAQGLERLGQVFCVKIRG